MRATWYVLEDGSVVDPNDCAPDERGDLRHKDGGAVARRGNTYSSRGVDLAETTAATAREITATGDRVTGADRQMKPAASGKGYRTRGAKAE